MENTVALERTKRKTAGTRMSSLVGKAVEDDEAFWSHSTWAEDKADLSDDGSFHESDEDSAAKVDKFDSDFDDSEEEDDGNEMEGEEEIEKEERRTKRAADKKNSLPSISKELQKLRADAAKRKAGKSFVGKSTSAIPARKSSRAKASTFSVSEIVGKRSLQKSTKGNDHISQKPKHKRCFTQEELLIEAVSHTEAENHKWLLNRKRLQVEEHSRADHSKKSGNGAAERKVISKFNSRRGCLNTFTFPEMDHVPEIFTRGKTSEEHRTQIVAKIQKENSCVITGKKARYKDPKTKLGYYDLNAFKELRRRYEAGETLDQRIDEESKPSTKDEKELCGNSNKKNYTANMEHHNTPMTKVSQEQTGDIKSNGAQKTAKRKKSVTVKANVDLKKNASSFNSKSLDQTEVKTDIISNIENNGVRQKNSSESATKIAEKNVVLSNGSKVPETINATSNSKSTESIDKRNSQSLSQEKSISNTKSSSDVLEKLEIQGAEENLSEETADTTKCKPVNKPSLSVVEKSISDQTSRKRSNSSTSLSSTSKRKRSSSDFSQTTSSNRKCSISSSEVPRKSSNASDSRRSRNDSVGMEKIVSVSTASQLQNSNLDQKSPPSSIMSGCIIPQQTVPVVPSQNFNTPFMAQSQQIPGEVQNQHVPSQLLQAQAHNQAIMNMQMKTLNELQSIEMTLNQCNSMNANLNPPTDMAMMMNLGTNAIQYPANMIPMYPNQGSLPIQAVIQQQQLMQQQRNLEMLLRNQQQNPNQNNSSNQNQGNSDKPW